MHNIVYHTIQGVKYVMTVDSMTCFVIVSNMNMEVLVVALVNDSTG